jgi:hypothetical protein
METVTEKKFLEKEELEKLHGLQEKTKALVVELGEIELVRVQLDVRRNQAEEFLTTISEEESTLISSLSEKYGKANINPETGEITELS